MIIKSERQNFWHEGWGNLVLLAICGFAYGLSLAQVWGEYLFVPSSILLMYAVSRQRPLRAGVSASMCAFVGLFISQDWLMGLARRHFGMSFSASLLVFLIYLAGTSLFVFLPFVFMRWARLRFGLREYMSAPFVFVAHMTLFPFLFPFFLSNVFCEKPIFLQNADVFGARGLDVLFCFFCFLIYECIFYKQKRVRHLLLLFGSGGIFLASSIYKYNFYLKLQNNSKRFELRKIGVVQPNRPSTFASRKPYPNYTLARPIELDLTAECAQNGADLVIWPEGRQFDYDFNADLRENFKKCAIENEVAFIFQDFSFDKNAQSRQAYVSALLVESNGKQTQRYHKNILIPYGEYRPWEKYLRKIAFGKENPHPFVPYSIKVGEEVKILRFGDYRVKVFMCYESLFPEYGADFAQKDMNGLPLFAVQVENGWYDSLKQTRQHAAASVLRALENRIPLVAAVKNGPSYAIDICGVKFDSSNHNSLQSKNFQFAIPKFYQKTFYAKNANIVKLLIIYIALIKFIFLLIFLRKK